MKLLSVTRPDSKSEHLGRSAIEGGEYPLDGAFSQFLIFFELTWGFILYDFWSPTEAERFKKNTGRLSSPCFCYLLEFCRFSVRVM